MNKIVILKMRVCVRLSVNESIAFYLYFPAFFFFRHVCLYLQPRVPAPLITAHVTNLFLFIVFCRHF